MTIMSKSFILLSTSSKIMMIMRSLRTLYCKMLKIDVLFMRDRVCVDCDKKISIKVDVDDRAIFDFLSCKSLDRESFDSVSRQDSYHVLEVHDL
jgi:hypothetical protein